MSILEILRAHINSPREHTVVDTDAQKLEYLQAIWAGQALVPTELANTPIDEVLVAVDELIYGLIFGGPND